MDRPVPIQTVHLFGILNNLLIDLLKSLNEEDWNKPTISPLWTVKDIAAHLLDTNMRSIATANNYSGKPPENIQSYQDLVTYLNELNAVWVKAMDRISPQQLIDLLQSTGKPYEDYLTSLNPFDSANYAVSWAGEEHSENWFDIARQYTEKWHHQQQIRDAVNKPGIMNRELFYPCIDTFMRGLPHAYRNTPGKLGALVTITISTDAGGNWYLQKNTSGWKLIQQAPGKSADAAITITPDTAWKLFTKGIKPEIAIQQATIHGDKKLAQTMFSLVAVMA
ncbi:maleylpyruvate isomerase N-terminal domain-containing protein [Mucilaginibacter xinganensis]|nr:maleylpyruvate isomerase N-terminal domain-containing protein [Mucilaginibacter xinganensis]